MRRGARRRALLLLAGVLLVSGACGPESCNRPGVLKCPRVYGISTGADPSQAYDLLIVGSGFRTDEQICGFRKAAGEVARILADAYPYCLFPNRLNFYRIDTRSDQGVSTARCTAAPTELPGTPGPVCNHTPLPPVNCNLVNTGTPVYHVTGEPVLRADLGVEYCPDFNGTGTTCKSLWLDRDGKKEALNLAQCVDPGVPPMDGVLVLANSRRSVGAAVANSSGGSVDLLVTGIPQSGGRVTGPGLFVHEFGHAHGLFDEYSTSIEGTVIYYPEHNLWKPDDPCWEPGMTYDPDLQWGLGCPSSPAPPECDRTSTPPTCPPVWVPSHPNNTTCPEMKSGVPDPCREVPGLWEGAFYRTDRYYRGMDDCVMREKDKPYCAVCVNYLVEKFAGVYGSPASPAPERCTPP